MNKASKKTATKKSTVSPRSRAGTRSTSRPKKSSAARKTSKGNSAIKTAARSTRPSARKSETVKERAKLKIVKEEALQKPSSDLQGSKNSASTLGDNARKILSVDIGGTSIKILVNGEAIYRKVPSGAELTPIMLVDIVTKLAKDWEYDYISIGYPGLTGPNGPLAEPYNLGPGWVAFDFAAAFGKPVKVLNDAALQAIGSYEGGRMLFLGLGTGLGSALIFDSVIMSLELSNLRWNSRQSVGDVVGKPALKRLGKRRWRRIVNDMIDFTRRAFIADYIVVGGGNAKYLKDLPGGVRVGHNQAAFRGGFRIWELDFIPAMADSVTNKELRVLY